MLFRFKQILFYFSLALLLGLVVYLAYVTGNENRYKARMDSYQQHVEICKTQNTYLINNTTYSCNLLKPPVKE